MVGCICFLFVFFWRYTQIPRLPPVQFCHIFYPRICEPFLISQWREEMHTRVSIFDVDNSFVRKMIVVIMTNYNSIDDWDITDLTGSLGVSLRT